MKAFLTFLVRAPLVWALFFAWQFCGVDGAGNVIRFYAAAMGFVLVLGALLPPAPSAMARPKSGPVVRAIILLEHVALVTALAWVGCTGLAAWWLLGLFGGLIYQHRVDEARSLAEKGGVPA